jgi:hypothetical protein
MRKTKNPRHSRIIRKWDGTPIAEIAEGPAGVGPVRVRAERSDLTVNGDTPSTETPTAKRPAEGEERIFGFEYEDELSNNT